MLHPLITPITAIIAGIVIIIFPAILNYVVGLYLILTGVVALMQY